MSYDEILETRGDWRVLLVLDECADEPYDDGQSPLLRLDRTSYERSLAAEHVMATGRPLDDDGKIEYAARHWDVTPASDDWRLFEKYLRAWYGTTQIETWHSGDYWYVTYDTARWQEYAQGGPGREPAKIDMDEYRAWCEGENYGWVLEKRVHWHTSDPDFEDRDDWEHADSCFGYYGRDYAEECALAELANAAKDMPAA